MLIAAGLGCVIALFALAGSAAAEANRGALALLGAVAGACVLYRMVAPPTPGGELLALSLREGAWLALIGAVAMVAGALWPARLGAAALARRRRAGRLVGPVRLDARGLSARAPRASRRLSRRPRRAERARRVRYPDSNPGKADQDFSSELRQPRQ